MARCKIPTLSLKDCIWSLNNEINKLQEHIDSCSDKIDNPMVYSTCLQYNGRIEGFKQAIKFLQENLDISK